MSSLTSIFYDTQAAVVVTTMVIMLGWLADVVWRYWLASRSAQRLLESRAMVVRGDERMRQIPLKALIEQYSYDTMDVPIVPLQCEVRNDSVIDCTWKANFKTPPVTPTPASTPPSAMRPAADDDDDDWSATRLAMPPAQSAPCISVRLTFHSLPPTSRPWCNALFFADEGDLLSCLRAVKSSRAAGDDNMIGLPIQVTVDRTQALATGTLVVPIDPDQAVQMEHAASNSHVVGKHMRTPSMGRAAASSETWMPTPSTLHPLSLIVGDADDSQSLYCFVAKLFSVDMPSSPSGQAHRIRFHWDLLLWVRTGEVYKMTAVTGTAVPRWPSREGPPPPEDALCIVCYSLPRQCLLLPCGHLQTCEVCTKKLSSCVLCRSAVESYINVVLQM